MKRNRIRLLLIKAIILCSVLNANSQVDVHFSQYYIYPHFINPATTGLMQGDWQVAGIYRNQWSNVSTPYSTIGLSGDITTSRKMNFGANILSQTAGNGGYKMLNGYLNLAYTGLRFGTEGKNNIVLGMQVGFINRRFDPTKFQMDDQWNPITGYSEVNPTADVFKTNSTTVLDMGAGVLYYKSTTERKSSFYLGAAVFHINRPKDPFNPETKGVIPMRIVGHAGVNLVVSDNVTMVPHVLYMKQGTAYEAMIGDYFQVSASDQTDLLFGANYRHKDAVSPFIGIIYNNLTLAATYDINMSPLGKMAHGANSIEFTLSFAFKNLEKFELRCPRL